MPDDFTRQVERAATQWVNHLTNCPIMHPFNKPFKLSDNAPWHPLVFYPCCLMPDDFTFYGLISFL
jgi:hypothetical protein